MSVPLDRLYDFLHDLCNRDDIVIYRFYPHGSKKLEDLTLLRGKPLNGKTYIICHDQEPLQWNLYSQGPNCNINLRAGLPVRGSWYSKVLLLHSEKKSRELEQYESKKFIGIYYWSHALIARDWFRYAELDPALKEPKFITKDFLIYNRAWSGTREYRLKFVELLTKQNLIACSNIKFNPIDQGLNYRDHNFSNSKFKIHNFSFEDLLPINNFDSWASADYDNKDYKTSAIEVVLETLFDDQRWHLTEKTLRPIAVGQPFILASTAGSLKYLREYGFKTFDGLINENYDNIVDPFQRLEAIVNEMQKIANLSNQEKTNLYAKLQEIANHNKQHFFSKNFLDCVINEYKTNLELGLNIFNSRRLL